MTDRSHPAGRVERWKTIIEPLGPVGVHSRRRIVTQGGVFSRFARTHAREAPRCAASPAPEGEGSAKNRLPKWPSSHLHDWARVYTL